MPEYAENPRADVNQDGHVDAGDLLEIRRPGNWQRLTQPPPSNDYTRVEYSGPDTEAAVFDLRSPRVIHHHLIRSTGRGIVADPFWAVKGVEVRDSILETHSYGLYLGVEGFLGHDLSIRSRMRDPIRIVGGRAYHFKGLHVLPADTDVCIRIHGNTEDVVIEDFEVEATNPWAIDLGEEFRGAGGCVRNVILRNGIIRACPQTVLGVRVRAQNVTLENVRGVDFHLAQPGAPLVTFEQHSCVPTGGRVLGCSVDGGRSLVGRTWPDTEVRS